jgi:hypothetical protein
MGLVRNPNKYEIPTNQNPNNYEIPTEAVHNPNNHNNPCRSKSQQVIIPTGTKSQQVRNPNRYKIPTKTHKLRQKLTFYILVANINFLLSQFNLI